MVLRITPVAGGLKAAQYAAMREMKLSLDQVMHPAASSMMSFGILGTGFQSVAPACLALERHSFGLIKHVSL